MVNEIWFDLNIISTLLIPVLSIIIDITMARIFHLIHNLKPTWSQIGLETVYGTREIIFELTICKIWSFIQRDTERGRKTKFQDLDELIEENELDIPFVFSDSQSREKIRLTYRTPIVDKCNVYLTWRVNFSPGIQSWSNGLHRFLYEIQWVSNRRAILRSTQGQRHRTNFQKRSFTLSVLNFRDQWVRYIEGYSFSFSKAEKFSWRA